VALVCDTSVLLAGVDRDDPDHKACAELISATPEALVVPGLVLAELDYWCRKLGLAQAWLDFLDDIAAGAWSVHWPTEPDVARARELISTYRDLDIGIVDASIVALLERLDEPKLASLDRRHFTVVRPSHVEALSVLP
jgi:predicted nucleic acid-binding protein